MNLHPEKLDKRRCRIVGRLASENRRYARGNFCFKGRFLAENGWEYPLTIKDISPGGMLVDSDFAPEKDQHIVMILDELGRFDAQVVRVTQSGFAVSILATLRKRDQLADRLMWLLNAERLGLHDERAGTRTQRKSEVHVTLPDGTRFTATSLDVSMSGMTIQSKEKVTIGERVVIGKLTGTIARHLQQGFAIRFDPPVEKETAAQAK